jgi:hypothetical protein
MKDVTPKHVGVEKAEYYHIGADGEGESGPFDTLEEAKEDAQVYLTDNRWRVPQIKIVKVVATSETEVTYATTWR